MPLTQLTRKSQVYVWDVAFEGSFVKLKKKLMTTPVLILSSTTEPFIVYSGSSKMGQGSVLM